MIHDDFDSDNSIDRTENDEPAISSEFNPLDLSSTSNDVFVLGEGSRDKVKFEWMITPWSECSQSCGIEDGFKVIFY